MATKKKPPLRKQAEPSTNAPLPVLAPWPHIDRFPIIIGSNITFQHITSCMREAIGGYRDRFVDVLSELLDHEPHGFSQLLKSVTALAGGDFEINAIDAEDQEASKIADEYRKQHGNIPNVTKAIARLAWADYYGIATEEILWKRGGDWDWTIAGLQMVQSRRLSYPDWSTWDLWIWDGGALDPGGSATGGLRIKDYPNKFVVHEAGLRADYPTRDGLGRILANYFALKRLILRVSASEFERFVKPWVVAYYHTGLEGHPRPATSEDQQAADTAVKALGQGYSTSAVLPDSIKIELVAAVTTLNRDTFLQYLDDSITRACNLQSYTASPGKSGARAASEVGERDESRLHRFKAKLLCESWREQVIKPWVRLNFPGKEALAPMCRIGVEDSPDPNAVLDSAGKAADLGGEIDAEQVLKRANLPIAKGGAKKLERPPPPTPEGLPGKKPGAKGAPKKAGKKPAPRAKKSAE